MRLLALPIVLVLATSPAAAQPPDTSTPALSDAVKAMVGAWEFTTANRDRLCTVRFRTEPATSGMTLDLDRNCVEQFGFLADVAGWTIGQNDFLRLVDAQGQPLLEFSEVESGVFEAPKPGEGIMFIQKPSAAQPAARTASDFAGDWVIARNGRPICTLTLTSEPAGDDFDARVSPPCDPLVTRFGPSKWRVDNDEIVLKSARGQTWRFEEAETKSWRRVPASANPVTMTKK
jgi:hypothetical protein